MRFSLHRIIKDAEPVDRDRLGDLVEENSRVTLDLMQALLETLAGGRKPKKEPKNE